MKTTRRIAGMTLLVAIAASTLPGCGGRHATQAPAEYCAPGANCFGYYSTCWFPWPAECPPCPSFAIIPPSSEQVLSDVPFNQEALPPALNLQP